MKIFLCQTQGGPIKKMTLNKVIRKKRKGHPVKIIGVAEVLERGRQ